MAIKTIAHQWLEHVIASGAHTFNAAAALPRFVEESVKTYAPAPWYAGARAIGPLATFDGAETWVDHPFFGEEES